MISFASGAKRPRMGIITTSTAGEVSLANAKGIGGEDQDMRFQSDVCGIVVRMRKPIDDGADTVPDEDYVLYVAEVANQMQPASSPTFDYHNEGIFETITGDKEWVRSDVNFPPRPMIGGGFEEYNFYFASRRESGVTGHNTSQWHAVVLEVLIYDE